MADNQEQLEYWNGPGAQRWLEFEDEIERGVIPFGAALLARLPLAPGARVLDVGCGAGGTLLAIARRIAPGGTLVGVDISRPLLARARERASARAAELGVSLELVLSDASSYAASAPARAPFDAVFSRFGVMFFDQPALAFGRLRSVLAEGGRLALACWRTLADNPWCAVPLEAARRVLPAPAESPDPRAPGPFAFGERDYLHGILSQAGFADIRLEPFDAPVVMSTTGLDGAVDQALRMGPLGRLMREQPEEVVARVREQVRPALERSLRGEQVSLQGAVWLVTARAP